MTQDPTTRGMADSGVSDAQALDAQEAPLRLCRKCSTQTRTADDNCPYCGAAYIKRRRRLRRRTKIIIACALALLVLGGAGTAVALKINHDNKVAAAQKRERERKAAAARRAAAAARIAAEERRRAVRERRAANRVQRSLRRLLVTEMETSIKKDAQKDVSDGLLDGPILSAQCDAVGIRDENDLSAKRVSYQCMVVTRKNGDGTVSGYRFAAKANFEDSSYTWHLGS